jgi:hypothetical protein
MTPTLPTATATATAPLCLLVALRNETLLSSVSIVRTVRRCVLGKRSRPLRHHPSLRSSDRHAIWLCSSRQPMVISDVTRMVMRHWWGCTLNKLLHRHHVLIGHRTPWAHRPTWHVHVHTRIPHHGSLVMWRRVQGPVAHSRRCNLGSRRSTNRRVRNRSRTTSDHPIMVAAVKTVRVQVSTIAVHIGSCRHARTGNAGNRGRCKCRRAWIQRKL